MPAVLRTRRALLFALLLSPSLVTPPVLAQHIRDHIRASRPPKPVSESQAADLTLTLSAVEPRLVQTWVRTAGAIKAGSTLMASLSAADAALVKAGQRVRAFPPSSKSSMYQARVTKVTPRGAGAEIEVSLMAPPRQNAPLYVIEIVVERGPFLSVPNEALIEEGDRHIVYVQRSEGQYGPQEIHTGIQGELYTQVLNGVKDGDQVVTFGSFFIDAEHKLKSSEQNAAAR
jgi:hypothetical protein